MVSLSRALVISPRYVPRRFTTIALLAALVVPSAPPCRAQSAADSAAALHDRGTRQVARSQFDSALASFRDELTLRHAIGESRGEASLLQLIGLLYMRVGQPDSALAYERTVLALVLGSATPDRAQEADARVGIGTVYYSTGHLDSALAYYRAALPLFRAVSDQRGEATTLNNLGALFGFEGLSQPDSALSYYRAALRLFHALGNRRSEATTLDNIGKVYFGTGRSDSALAYFRSALPLARAVGDRYAESRELSNIGQAFGRREPDSTMAYTQAALRAVREMGDRRSQAAVLVNLADLYSWAGKRDSALALLMAAVPLTRAAGDRRQEAVTLGEIGAFYGLTQQPDSALVYLRAALRLLRVVGDRASEATTLGGIAVVYQRLGHRAASLAASDSAVALYATVRLHAGSDASAVAFAEKERGATDFWVRGWLARAVDSSASLPAARGTARPAFATALAAALAAAERGRAQGLRDLLARSRAAAGSPLTDLLWAGDTVPGADLTAEAALELAPMRRTRTAALYYFLSADTLTTWLLNASGELRLAGHAAVKGDSLAALVAMLRAALGVDAARTPMARGGDLEQERVTTGAPPNAPHRARGVDDGASPEAQARLRAATAALGTLLLPASLASDVPSGTDLVIVPHGVLGLVPFAALPVPGDTLSLGARYALRYAPSLRALAAADGRAADWRGATHALVVGDPAMPTVAGVDGRRAALRDLPAARSEGEAVARRFGVAALTGGAATETAVRQALPNARLVHLATHGLAYGSEARVRDSYVALAPDATNDGLLTIGELLDAVPALSADLVVLSACQTGLGNLQQAEGTVGFQRALLAKGARSVLVSLWSVDDRATALLMRQFYAHWLGTDGKPARSKSEALRLAQVDVRLTPGLASPRYWAAFQLVGAP